MQIVHVACKLATGLSIEGIQIKGSAFDRGLPAHLWPESYGGYVLTLNVPAEVWERWAKDNKDSVMVRQNLIFADSNLAALKKKAKQMKATNGGFGPLDPRKPWKM